MPPASNIILSAEEVSGSQTSHSGQPSRIESVSLACAPHTTTLLWGADRCGKGALLRLLGLLEAPACGEVFFHGTPTRDLSGHDRAELRNRHFGFLFTEPFLLPSFSIVENIAMPLLKISSATPETARVRTLELMQFVGLSEDTEFGSESLSFYEQQLVSLARALANQPDVLIVENVDHNLRHDELLRFVELLRKANAEFKTTTIITASSDALAPLADRVVHIAAGAIHRDSQIATAHGGSTS